MHITAVKLSNRVHEIEADLLKEILLKGGPDKEDATETISTIRDETSGGVVLRFNHEGVMWWLPAWLGGKLTLMLPDCERTLLTYALGLEVAL